MELNTKEIVEDLLKKLNETSTEISRGERFRVYALLTLKTQLRVLHAYILTNADNNYIQEYNKMNREITAYEQDLSKKMEEDPNAGYGYLQRLMNLFELQITELNEKAIPVEELTPPKSSGITFKSFNYKEMK